MPSLAQVVNTGAQLMGLFGNLFGHDDTLANAKAISEHNAKLNYQYNEKYVKNTPSWTRTGLESAGYNPILGAMNGFSPATSNVSSSAGGSTSSDRMNAISNAYQTFRLNNEQIKSQVALNRATQDNQTAQASLNEQNAISETIKQDGYRIDNNIKSITEEMKKFDKSTQQYRYLQDMKEQLSRIRLNNMSADASLINAHSNQINAGASVTNARASMINATQGSPVKILADNIVAPLKNSYSWKTLGKYTKKFDSFVHKFIH